MDLFVTNGDSFVGGEINCAEWEREFHLFSLYIERACVGWRNITEKKNYKKRTVNDRKVHLIQSLPRG